MIEVARYLSGDARLVGTDSISLQHWLLSFGESSVEIHQIVAEFVEWLANEHPP